MNPNKTTLEIAKARNDSCRTCGQRGHWAVHCLLAKNPAVQAVANSRQPTSPVPHKPFPRTNYTTGTEAPAADVDKKPPYGSCGSGTSFSKKPPYGSCGICASPGHWMPICPLRQLYNRLKPSLSYSHFVTAALLRHAVEPEGLLKHFPKPGPAHSTPHHRPTAKKSLKRKLQMEEEGLEDTEPEQGIAENEMILSEVPEVVTIDDDDDEDADDGEEREDQA